MKLLQLTLLSVALLVGCTKEISDTVAIKETFTGYKTAILNDDGEAAFLLVDDNTKSWYDTTLQGALTYNKDDILKLGLIDKLQVILIRHRIPKQILLEMTGEDLFKYAVNEGWVGKNGVSNLEIGKIVVNQDFATGVVKSNGQDSPLKFHFYRIDGKWCIDLTEMIMWGEAAFAQQVKASGQSEIDFISQIVQIASGSPVQESIWTPLQD